MAAAVVDALEVVEVGEEQRQRRAEPARAGDLGLERLDEAAAVDEAGELVGDGLLADDLVQARVLERDRRPARRATRRARTTRARSRLRAGRRRRRISPPVVDSPRSSSIGSSPTASPTRASSRSSSSTRPPAAPVASTVASRITGSSPLVSCVAASALPTCAIASRACGRRCAPRGARGSSARPKTTSRPSVTSVATIANVKRTGSMTTSPRPLLGSSQWRPPTLERNWSDFDLRAPDRRTAA